jgi:hypothetical protein
VERRRALLRPRKKKAGALHVVSVFSRLFSLKLRIKIR